MDASEYKDYILTLPFIKYVSDKFNDVDYADITIPKGGSFDDIVNLKGNKNIGEEINKVIAKLAKENELCGVIDNANFNNETKLGVGQEMVDKLTGLIAIFQRLEFNFKVNKIFLAILMNILCVILLRKVVKVKDNSIHQQKCQEFLLK